eukprot:scaffold12585_cov35-Tisochrysis_lutea.AAC.2
MGSSKPANKRMRNTTTTTLRPTHATSVWKGAATQPGRPKIKRAAASTKQPQGRGAAILSSVRPVVSANYSPIPYSKRRAHPVANFGRQPNFELYAMTPADVPEFVPLSSTATPTEHYPEPPVDFSSRPAYFASCAPIAPTFKQRTQPWFAARSVACTASATASILGVGFGYSDNHFRMFDKQQQPQPLQAKSLPMEWGILCVCEQGLHFVSPSHPLVQDTIFGSPFNIVPLAASPDALMCCEGFRMLIEVKSACPFDERDDGIGAYRPFKRALGEQGVHMSHFVQCQVQMLATQVQHCLLVGWDVEECKVLYVPFDVEWCKQMLFMLGMILFEAGSLQGKRPDLSCLHGHAEFVKLTKQRCCALKKPCSVASAKGSTTARWLKD